MEILVPEVDSQVQMFHVQQWCCLGEIGEKLSWKFELMVTTIYKTINTIHIVFCNCLQARYKFAFFSHLGWYIGWTSDHICQFDELFSYRFWVRHKLVHKTMYVQAVNGPLYMTQTTTSKYQLDKKWNYFASLEKLIR